MWPLKKPSLDKNVCDMNVKFYEIKLWKELRFFCKIITKPKPIGNVITWFSKKFIVCVKMDLLVPKGFKKPKNNDNYPITRATSTHVCEIVN